LEVEEEDILEGKIDSLMQRLEKMEIQKKEAQDFEADEARSKCEECGEMAMSKRIARRKPRCSTI
jgi:formylmethanofuran dehydrogenase subunit E